jgi:aromatase
MHSENTVLIQAPLDKVFSTAATLSDWPMMLPHYRWITFLQRSPERSVVSMKAWRSIAFSDHFGIPVRWTSSFEVDPVKYESHFQHLTAFTKGMRVVWTFTPTKDGVIVRIQHDLNSPIPVLGKLLVEPIVGRFFIQYIANQTLAHMKRFVERNYGS